MEEKEISKQETTLVKYTNYLPEELITKIKIQAALQRKKGYQIIKQALKNSLKKVDITLAFVLKISVRIIITKRESKKL